MPNKNRNPEHTRGKWSQDQLTAALEAIKKGTSIRQASIENGIPRKTLERRFKSGNVTKDRMGPTCTLGKKNEEKMVQHIKIMQKHGFPFTRDDLRALAYNFANQLKIKHRFNNDTQKAGYEWLYSFLSRHPDISVRKSEGLSLARSLSMNRQKVNEYFKFLGDIFEQNGLLTKPGSIYNMDETGLQLNNRPGHVIAEKGSKSVSSVISGEKGETITVIACCNAEGIFLPPACIMKGKNKKPEFEDGMPPGSVVYMSEKSAYINTTLFFDWLRTHFLPRKSVGTVALILDGHSSHCNSIEMLEFAQSEGILLICLPSRTTHYLQPLDRAVFKSIKHNFFNAASKWLKNHPGRKLTRLQFGELLHETWSKSATPANAISGFKATGIYPFNPDAIPDYAFIDSDVTSTNDTPVKPMSPLLTVPLGNKCNEVEVTTTNSTVVQAIENIDIINIVDNVQPIVSPTKILKEISPVPSITKDNTLKRRNDQTINLTSSENIKKLKLKNAPKKPLEKLLENHLRKLRRNQFI